MSTISMYPAGNGDAFLIVHNRTGLADRGIDLSLVVSTHIDADHIGGLVRFFGLNGPANAPRIIAVRRVWHNSFRSLVLPTPNSLELSKGDEELLQDVCRRGYALPAADLANETEISALQGSSLASLLRVGRFNWNEGDGSQPIVAPYHLKLDDDVTITVLGPPPERLHNLRDCWIRELRRVGVTGALSMRALLEDAFEFLCSYEHDRRDVITTEISRSLDDARQLKDAYQPDDSATNGSSLSLIIQTGSRRLLFLGDAWAEDCEEALSEMASTQMPMLFDAIKLSHHGSLRNTSPQLLQLIDSPRFLVSSNGEGHNHPDVEVLRAVVDRPSPFARDMYFNFSTAASRDLMGYKSKSNASFAVHEEGRKIEIP